MAPKKRGESKPRKTRKSEKSEPEPKVPKSRAPRKKLSNPRKNTPSGTKKTSRMKKTNDVAAEVSETTFDPIPSTSKMSTPVARRRVQQSRTPRTRGKTFKRFTDVARAYHASETSSSSEEGGEQGERKSKGPHITPAMYDYYLNAYKQTPDYADLKAKRFNTSFIHNTPRRDRHIEIFTPEEEEEMTRRVAESLPVIKNKINVKVPGEKFKDVFKDIRGMPSAFTSSSSTSEEDKQKAKPQKPKKKTVMMPKRKRGRPKAVGYKGVPLPDNILHPDYSDISRSLREDRERYSSSDEDYVITKDNSILHSLLTAPPNKKAVKLDQPKSRAARSKNPDQPKSCAASSSKNTEIKKRKYVRKRIYMTKKLPSLLSLVSRLADVDNESGNEARANNELEQYKDLLGDRRLKVVLKRLSDNTVKSFTEKKKPKIAVTRMGKED